jgi:NhaP-type Na+/H+ or K+/H+ antiporter
VPRHPALLLLAAALACGCASGCASGSSVAKTLTRPVTRADDVALRTSLQSAATFEQAYAAEHGEYAPTAALVASGFRAGSVVVTVTRATAQGYWLRGTAGTEVLFLSTGGGISEADCTAG